MKVWVHGLELDNMTENNIPFKILKKEGWDDYYIECDLEEEEKWINKRKKKS